MKRGGAILIAVSWVLAGENKAAVTIETVPVGNPGNPHDTLDERTVGRVDYAYNIGKFEITAGQ
jgi:hypothetical protein